MLRLLLVAAMTVAGGMPQIAAAAPGAVAKAAAPGAAAKKAARLFEEGQALYVQGRYPEAIHKFEAANRLAPHPSVQFNVGRCHESMGNVAQALASYQEALQATSDPTLRSDLQQRISRLRAFPVRVFISSQPPGATVTIDGRPTPEPGVTPLVTKLEPGEHVLLLARRDHPLTPHRIEIAPGKDRSIQVTLAPELRSCPPPCPPQRMCPDTRLVRLPRLAVHLKPLIAIIVQTDRPLAVTPGIELALTLHRWLLGGFAAAAVDSRGEPSSQWAVAMLEGGYLFPFRHALAQATLGLGLSVDRMDYGNNDVKEYMAFTSGVGVGVQAFIKPWLSLGANLRAGIGYGDRASRQSSSVSDRGVFGWGSLTWNVGFHL